MNVWDDFLESLWRKDDRVFRTVGIIDSPAVILEDVRCPTERVTLVVGSLLYQEYARYTPEDKPVEA